MVDISILIGGIPTPLKKYESQWERLSHILWENKNCSKPPASWFMRDISILIGGIPTPLKN